MNGEYQRRFRELLERGAHELFEDHRDRMDTPDLIVTPNPVDTSDLSLFFRGVDGGLISLERGARFNTEDRPTKGGRWGLLSRAKDGGWFNAEYLPQLAAYVDAILELGYPSERVLFELPGRSLQLDLAILDDEGQVVVLGEAKRNVAMLDPLLAGVTERFSGDAPGESSKKRGDEARQLAWRLWTVRAPYCWMIAPGARPAYRVETEPLVLSPLTSLP